MQITVVRSGSSCPLGEVLEHSEKVGPGGGVAYIYIYIHIIFVTITCHIIIPCLRYNIGYMNYIDNN